MNNTPSVTGGDLHNLWKCAHMALPEAENIYVEATNIHDEILSGGDSDTFGKVFPAWQMLQKINQQILYQTAQSLKLSRMTIDLAVAQFIMVDEKNGGGITAAGEELGELLEDPNDTDPELVVEPTGDAVAPDFNTDK